MEGSIGYRLVCDFVPLSDTKAIYKASDMLKQFTM